MAMTFGSLDGAVSWIGVSDLALVALATLLVAMAWWSEKIHMERCRLERVNVQVPPSSRPQVRWRWRGRLQDSQA